MYLSTPGAFSVYSPTRINSLKHIARQEPRLTLSTPIENRRSMIEFGFSSGLNNMLRYTLLLVSVILLQSCGLTDRFFGDDECDDGSCEAPVLLDNSNSEQKWFCYGKAEDQPWQCQNARDDSQIVAVKPEPPAAVAEQRQIIPQPEQISAPLAVQAPPTPPQPVRLPISPSAQEILDAPSNHYAVQLIALRDLSGVQEYATLNGVKDPLVVKIRNDQTDWFILLLGTYAERTLAEAAKREWETAKVLRVQPWIRQLGGLQDAMRLAQNPS